MKRGTGWIPDYPELSDYTLEKDIEKLSEQVQSQGSTASIESLAQKICNALDILAQQADESNQEKLRQLKEDLETQVLGGVEFITVDVYYDLKEGSSGSEVRLIKKCLQSLQESSEIKLLHEASPLGQLLRKDITDMKLTKAEIFAVKSLAEAQLWYVHQYKKYSPESSFGIDLGAILCLRFLSSSVKWKSRYYGDKYNLEVAKQWSDFSEKFPEVFQKLIQPQEDWLINYDISPPRTDQEFLDDYYPKNQFLKNTREANTQLSVHTRFIVRLYDFWYDLKELDFSCSNFKEQFCKIFVGENQRDRVKPLSAPRQIEKDLQSIKNSQQRLSADLDAIQVAKDSLDKFEVPLYKGRCLPENEIEQVLEPLKRPFRDDIDQVKNLLIQVGEWLNRIQLQIETLIFQHEAPEITSEEQIQLIENFEIEACALSHPYSSLGPHHYVGNIIEYLSKIHLPQIPPQLLSLNEIPVESPIHIDLFKLIEKELIEEVKSMLPGYDTELSWSPPPDDFSARFLAESPQKIISVSKAQASKEVHSLIKPIVEVVAQMLMPLGQYGGLSEIISKALDKIQSLVEQEDKKLEHESSSSSQKTLLALQKMLQETLEQHNNSLVEKDIMPLGDFSLRLMALSALKKISTSSDSLNKPEEVFWEEGMLGIKIEENKDYPSTENYFLPPTCSLVQLINKIPENTEELLKRRQPLFRIRSKKKKASKESKQIQFPISQKLREEHSEIQAQLNCERDWSEDPEDETLKLEALEKRSDVYLTLPEFVDLSYWFSPIEDQGSLNSCTAHAGIALLEYAQHKSSGTYIDASPLFLYKVTRNLLQQTGDVGASMRDTMKAMTAFGVCPEAYWTYDETQLDHDPPAFCYSFAESYKALKYFRLDHGNIDRSVLLAQIKVLLVSEIPCAFGFTLYDSAYEESNFAMGHLPLPTNRDKVIGGHVVVAVGYHDRKIIKNSNGDEFEGALLIRNSWGRGWGQGGYGWMPYEYVLKGLTADWWSLLKAEWLASGNFGAGASAWDSDQGGDGRKGRRQ
jgi:C1A family cysteine protease